MPGRALSDEALVRRTRGEAAFSAISHRSSARALASCDRSSASARLRRIKYIVLSSGLRTSRLEGAFCHSRPRGRHLGDWNADLERGSPGSVHRARAPHPDERPRPAARGRLSDRRNRRRPGKRPAPSGIASISTGFHRGLRGRQLDGRWPDDLTALVHRQRAHTPGVNRDGAFDEPGRHSSDGCARGVDPGDRVIGEADPPSPSHSG